MVGRIPVIFTVDSPTQWFLVGITKKKHTKQGKMEPEKKVAGYHEKIHLEGIHLFHSKSFHDAKDHNGLKVTWFSPKPQAEEIHVFTDYIHHLPKKKVIYKRNAKIISLVPSAVCHLF